MKVELRHSFNSRLPDLDLHPYRSGAWQPQNQEYDAWDMDVIGEIPTDLNGVYLRNTENPLFEPIKRYHPFDGDGMLHSISFEAGEARYANRFVRTDGFIEEQKAQRSLWAGITEHPKNAIASHGWGARTRMKDSSSTDVIVHGGAALASFYQCGELYRLDPRTLENLGKTTWQGQFPAEGVSAHCKVDEHTGELLFFNYSTEAPFMKYGVVSKEGILTTYEDIPLPGPRLPHDMAFTENWSILNDLPLYWEPEALAQGYYSNTFNRNLASRFALIPRHGKTTDIKWFEADPTFVLHFANAYEEGDEVVLDGYFQHNPTARGTPRQKNEFKGFETLDVNTLEPRAHRWRFNLRTGQCTEETLHPRLAEFPMINGRHAGRPYQYSYNTLCTAGIFAFNGLSKLDVQKGTDEVISYPDGTFISETVMAPRAGSSAEDDGYLITFSSNINDNVSHCLIYDASHLTDEPIAKIRLPERIASGTHATWAPLEDLSA